ncbi:MAG: DUF1302 domain-containing protein [Alphaproteobacteria bacterium]|nr:DUF1302 domain-containing protein [Alphaproteobacteria bacterium]
MSTKSNQRVSLLGSAAALALLTTAPGAQAVETKFGDVTIMFDTTVSVGGSVRTSDRETAFLAESNGGSNIDTRFLTGFNTADVTSSGGLPGTIGLNGLPSGVNREGSVNGDDGRLNYDSGDLTSANIKANHDLQISFENYKIFVRGVEFYDVILNDGSHTARSDLADNVTNVVGRDAQLLDAFISADYTVGDLPLNIRAGKQVISWGEGTFILNGINVANPIDVSAFRRPGAEIKEGLLPVNSLFASIGLPIDGMSVAGYYMLDWEPFKIDQPGTPFSGSDVFGSSNLLNTDPRGNVLGTSFLSGNAYSGTFRRNCNTDNLGTFKQSAARQVAALAAFDAAYDAVIHANCAVGSDPIDFDYKIPTGQLEFVKNTFGSEDIVTHDPQREASDDGQYGIRLNYFAEELNGTEFGFYHQNYHSRLPFVGFRAGAPTVGISTTAPTSSVSGRATAPVGFLYNPASVAAVLLNGAVIAPNGYAATGNPLTLYAGGATERTLFQNTLAGDPNNFEGLMANVAAAIATNLGGPFAAEAGSIVAAAAASGATQADFDNLSRINALLVAASISTDLGGALLMDGSELLAATNPMSDYFEYPEDIEQWGFSFNTTIGSWGLQGEFSFRPNAPFQLDTDQLTIASAFSQCASWGVGTAGLALQLIQTLKQYNCPYNDDLTQTAAQKAAAGLAPGLQDLQGFIRDEMYTASIGTTATFTQSDWLIDKLGADLGILVTEAGMVFVPNVEDTWVDKLASPLLAGPQFQNTGCQGSDLPLGGFLDLRDATSKQCRPTNFSTGLVLLYRLDYNNAFDTGFVVSPQLTYSWDIEGTTPAPYGNFIEDRQAVSLGVTGTLNNNFRLGASYTNFFSGHVNSKSRDQDFASLTASYSF